MGKFSHVDYRGKVNMVDVGNKKLQQRRAVAGGTIFLSEETLNLIRENQVKKGDVLTVAQIAGIQAAKQTSSLIPLCHPLTINKIDVKMEITSEGVIARSEVWCIGRTGVEMEALTAVGIALLTVYDMCKAVDKKMKIGEIRLLEKEKEYVE
ncbi:MAG: cyclic pyranopterin monophosphate synthase MoaC [Sedimentisphaerales bacterium]|nr:cyclic pyranopterin monophosphate synthase MoaC [Sedimentisphaerales bacterium]